MASVYKVIGTFDHVVFQDHVKTQNQYNSTTTESMATKFYKVVTYIEGHLPIKSHDPLITPSCKITDKLKPKNKLKSPTLQYIWPLNLTGW